MYSFWMFKLAVHAVTASLEGDKSYKTESYFADINMQWCISQTQQPFIMFIIVLGQHVSILTESSSGPSKIQILT